jgi:hypothetical protein
MCVLDETTENGRGPKMRKRCMMLVVMAALANSPASAATETQSMSFESCLATIRQVATKLAVAPINIVETDILRMVKFKTVDGSVLVTCSRPDNEMIIITTP